MRSRVVCALAGVAVALVPALGATAPRTVEEILAILDQRAAETPAVSCKIEQTKELVALTVPVALEGSIAYMQPAFLKVELSGDENLALCSDGETLWFVDRDLDEVEEMPVTGETPLSGVLPGFVLSDAEVLRSQCDIALEPSSDSSYRLRVLPRVDSELPFREATVDLDSHLRIGRTVVEYQNGDRVTTRFRQWRRHRSLPPQTFICQRRLTSESPVPPSDSPRDGE